MFIFLLNETAETYFYLMNIFKGFIIRTLKDKNNSNDLNIKALFYEDLITKMLVMKKSKVEISDPVLRLINELAE